MKRIIPTGIGAEMATEIPEKGRVNPVGEGHRNYFTHLQEVN